MAMIMPELYAKLSTNNVNITKTLLKKYKHLLNFKKNPSILEFGFASGENSKQTLQPYLPHDYKEFVAVDISEPMVERARKNNTHIPRSKFYCLDTSAPDLPEMFQNRFDNVFSIMTIHLVNNPRQTFANTFKMLKGGGETFQTFFKHTPCDSAFLKLSKHPKWGKEQYNQKKMLNPYYDKPEPKGYITADLKAAGFQNIQIMEEDTTYNFESEESLKGLYTSVNTTLSHIPADELEEYKEDYWREIRNLYTLCEPENYPNHLVKQVTFCVVWAKKE
uniref:Juvenile hormone acid O-methyltransferase-like n=1 Tax=Diabrotica virgifera virgifera TaxID=50390 RepID=A0A6P7G6Y8_DIAVI